MCRPRRRGKTKVVRYTEFTAVPKQIAAVRAAQMHLIVSPQRGIYIFKYSVHMLQLREFLKSVIVVCSAFDSISTIRTTTRLLLVDGLNTATIFKARLRKTVAQLL